MATGTVAAPAANHAPQAMPAPFRVGVQRTLATDGYTQSTVLSAATQQLPVYTPSPNAFLRGLWIYAQMTAVNTSNTVLLNGDGPFSVYQSISFNDTGGKPIVGPITGYDLAMINKFGGYAVNGDPRASAIYSFTSGSGTSAGTFAFTLYLPLEVVSRSGMGALENKSSASAFQLLLTVNTLAGTYANGSTSAPATSSTLQTRVLEDGWWQPKAADANGQPLAQTPPAPGSTQYWTKGSYAALNGATQTQISQGLGYPIRTQVFENYDTSNSTRATGNTNFPDPIQFIYKGTTIWNVPKVFWQDQMSKAFGLTSATADSALGLENGIYVLDYKTDFGLRSGAELSNGYLVTQQGDQFQLVGSFGASSTLYALVNYIAPANGNPASLRTGR